MKIDNQLPPSISVAKKQAVEQPKLEDVNNRLSVRKVKELPQQIVEQSQLTSKTRDFRLSMHEKSGLLQSIVSDKLTGEVIRKMPADEYLDLVHFISEVLRDSLDKNI